MCVKLEIPLANTGSIQDYDFTPELSNFDLHIILYITSKLYKNNRMAYFPGVGAFEQLFGLGDGGI